MLQTLCVHGHPTCIRCGYQILCDYQREARCPVCRVQAQIDGGYLGHEPLLAVYGGSSWITRAQLLMERVISQVP